MRSQYLVATGKFSELSHKLGHFRPLMSRPRARIRLKKYILFQRRGQTPFEVTIYALLSKLLSIVPRWAITSIASEFFTPFWVEGS